MQVALVPIRIFFQGKDDNPRLFDGKLNPYLLIFPFFAFFLINKDLAIVKTEKLILLAFAVLYLMFAFLTVGMRIRYVAPIIPPLVILAVYGLHAIIKILMEKYPAVSAGAGTLVILIGFLFFLTTNAAYIFRQFQIVDPFIYLSGRLSRDAYIEKYRPEYPVIQYANSHLAEDQKILGLFLGNRSYYSDREIIFDTGLFRQAVINARSADMIASDLKKSGITHLIIRYDIFHTWSNAVFDARQKEMLRIFYDSNIRLIFAKGGYGLYHLN